MTTTRIHRELAKIYAFPTKVRSTTDDFRGKTGSVKELASKRLPNIACGSAWYHEEAIQNADDDLKS